MLSSKTLVLEGWLSAKASPFESPPKKKRRIFCETTLSAIRRGTGRWGVSGVLCRPSLRFRTIPRAPKKIWPPLESLEREASPLKKKVQKVSEEEAREGEPPRGASSDHLS